MAKVVTLVDDYDGQPIAADDGGTFRFGVGDETYELDLSSKNQAKFEKLLQPWIDKSSKVEAPPAAPGGRGRAAKRTVTAGGSGMSKDELQAVRDWAASKGIEVAAKGRIAASVIADYEAAHKR